MSASVFAKTLPQSYSSRTVLVKCTPAPRTLAERRAILKGLQMTTPTPTPTTGTGPQQQQRPAEIDVFRKLEATDPSSFIAVTADADTASRLVADAPFRRVMVSAAPRAAAAASQGVAPTAPGPAAVAEPVVVQALARKLQVNPQHVAKKPRWWQKAQEKKRKEEEAAAKQALEAEAARMMKKQALEKQQQQHLEVVGPAAAVVGEAAEAGEEEEEGLAIQRKEFTIHVFPANKHFNHTRLASRGLLHGPWPLHLNNHDHNYNSHHDHQQSSILSQAPRETFMSAALRRSVPAGRLAPSLKDWDTGRQMAIGRGTATAFDDRAAWELLGVGVRGAPYIQHRLHQKEMARKIPAVMRSLLAVSKRAQQQQQNQQQEQISLGRDDDEARREAVARSQGYGQG